MGNGLFISGGFFDVNAFYKPRLKLLFSYRSSKLYYIAVVLFWAQKQSLTD
jgi:hypothetical protein